MNMENNLDKNFDRLKEEGDNWWQKFKNLILCEKFKENNNLDCIVPKFDFLDKENFSEKIEFLKEKFRWKKVAVRSSSFFEDLEWSSNAWAYETFLNVEVEDIWEYFSRIQNHSLEKFWHNIPVVVQEMAEDVKYSWVLFTIDPDSWKPYVTINYHDWIWEDLVSWNSTWKVAKYLKFNSWKNIQDEWHRKLFEISKIIEDKYWKSSDIEFAISEKWAVYLLQLRPITTEFKDDFDEVVNKKMISKYSKLIKKVFVDNDFVFWDMIDVNPEELFWKEDFLIKTFFQDIFTKISLLDSRKEFWYLWEEDFSVFILDKFYVDLEKNLKTFLPNTLNKKEVSLLIDFYKLEVKKDVSLQKKLDSEFYPINNSRVWEILNNEFFDEKISIDEKNNLEEKFRSFFKNLENNLKEKSKKYFDLEKNILDDLWFDNFSDLLKIKKIDLNIPEILEKILFLTKNFSDYARWAFYYSWLQDSNSDFFKWNHYLSKIIKENISDFSYKIPHWFNFLSFIDEKISIQDLKDQWYWEKFIDDFQEVDIFLIARENLKFLFMNLIRFLWEKISEKISKNKDVKNKYLNIDDLKNLKFEDLIKFLDWEKNLVSVIKQIEKNKLKKNISKILEMPSVINSKNNIDTVLDFDSSWSFIWEWKMEWEIFYLEDLKDLDVNLIKWKILVLENATPEIDIYLPYLKWIITRNWWPLAHIAIRARELSLPSVVWTWVLFDKIKNNENLKIDFDQKIIFM